jgi:pyruvate ferredoxin oxidoreductase delta subunit
VINAQDINEKTPWQDLTPGGEIYEAGTARAFNTGVWRTNTPVFHAQARKHCMLCVPFCPDSAIPVKDGKRLDFNYMHCKGCGICENVCPFPAITMVTGGVPHD